MKPMIESGSSLGVFRTCPKKYEFSYEDMLSSQRYSHSLGYGSFVHLFRALYHGARVSPLDLGKAAKEIEEFSAQQLSQYPEAKDQIEADRYLASKVVEQWIKYWEKHESSLGEQNFNWLEVEAEWAFKVGHDDQSPFTHVGKRDGYLYSKRWGKHFLYELKTAASKDEDNYLARLQLDYQINSNILALQKEGKPVDGVVYDVIWKPALRRKTNRKTMADETLDEFNQRLLDEYVANPQEYFTRVTVTRSTHDLQLYERELEQQFMILSGMNVKYRNPSVCNQFGQTCQFFNLCMDPAMQEQRANFIKRDKKLPELSGKIQENK